MATGEIYYYRHAVPSFTCDITKRDCFSSSVELVIRSLEGENEACMIIKALHHDREDFQMQSSDLTGFLAQGTGMSVPTLQNLRWMVGFLSNVRFMRVHALPLVVMALTGSVWTSP